MTRKNPNNLVHRRPIVLAHSSPNHQENTRYFHRAEIVRFQDNVSTLRFSRRKITNDPKSHSIKPETTTNRSIQLCKILVKLGSEKECRTHIYINHRKLSLYKKNQSLKFTYVQQELSKTM